MRVRKDVPNLRQTRIMRCVARIFRASNERFSMRLVHYSLQGNHLHLIVEAEHRGALSRGMRGLVIRMALAINRVLGRAVGKVFADRYHAHVLRTLTETRNAVSYVTGNKESHWRRAGRSPSRGWRADIYSSAALSLGELRAWVLDWLELDPVREGSVVAAPETWLQRRSSG